MEHRSALEGHLLRPALFAKPERLVSSAWLEHIPFAFWLVGAFRPRTLVELGTHNGASYSAFLQGAMMARLDVSATAVDTWTGDAHAGAYSDEVFAEFEAYHTPRFAQHSRLLRMTFDEALPHIEDGSVDLLHIDGLHTYEAVRHDFEIWKPKLSPRGLVLFHDTAERRADFGVWRLWEELTAAYPCFTFEHGHGLGVALVGAEPDPSVAWLAGLGPDESEIVRTLFFTIGARYSAELRDRDHAAAQAARERVLGEAQARAGTQHAEAIALIAAQAAALQEQVRVMSTYAAQFTPHDAAPAQPAEPVPQSSAEPEQRQGAEIVGEAPAA